ncbi:MAG: response regulator [Parcubacteria group bacterium]
MPNQSLKSLKILLVEDEKMLSEMYVAKFSKEGVKVMTAADGVAGLEIAKRELPDIILLDIIIPKIDGFAVLKELKSDPSTRKIPIILLTNLGQDEDVNKGKDLGADDYFIKSDHTPAEVVLKVRSFFEKK